MFEYIWKAIDENLACLEDHVLGHVMQELSNPPSSKSRAFLLDRRVQEICGCNTRTLQSECEKKIKRAIEDAMTSPVYAGKINIHNLIYSVLLSRYEENSDRNGDKFVDDCVLAMYQGVPF